jgi:hypothetical protein
LGEGGQMRTPKLKIASSNYKYRSNVSTHAKWFG